MDSKDKITIECDPKTGLCTLPDFENTSVIQKWNENEEVIYIGDPMCSWCWGISPHVNALKRFSAKQEIEFNLIMGGLRAGGGQVWDEEFKAFLKHHWIEITERSGQPFNMDFFNKRDFNYDTEPACRAVVTARTLSLQKSLPFYELIQNQFYVQSEDPKEINFYRPICNKLSIDFELFTQKFNSKEMIIATQNDFNKSKQLGVRGFPTIIYRKNENLYLLSQGYTEFETLRENLLNLRKK